MTLSSKLTILLTPLLLLGCQASKPADVPPVTMLFDHNNINQEVKMNVTIEDPRTYSVFMNYYLEKPEEYEFLSSKKPTAEDIENSDNLGEILGLRYEDTFEDLGAPAKYHVKIYDKQKGRNIADGIIKNPETSAVSSGRYAILATSYLAKGQYSIYVTYLGGSAKLNNLYTQIIIKRDHHGK